MDNVVELFAPKEEIEVDISTLCYSFIHDSLIPWAEFHGLNIDSQRFKMSAATIATCLQGLFIDEQR